MYSNLQARQTRDLTSKSTLKNRANIFPLREKKRSSFPLKLQQMPQKGNL